MNKFREYSPITNPADIQKSKEKAIQIMLSYGLREITSKRQESNDTLCFIDDATGARYAIYADGAVRRFGTAFSPYRLNRSILEKAPWGGWRRKNYYYQPGNYALLAETIRNAVYKYRNENA